MGQPSKFGQPSLEWVPDRLPCDRKFSGTGPYPVAGKILWADMASFAFVVPPLIEAFALYLLHHDKL